MNCPAFFCCNRGILVMLKIAIPTAIRQARCLRDIAAGGRLENLSCVKNLCSEWPETLKNSQSFVLTLRLCQFMRNWQRFVFSLDFYRPLKISKYKSLRGSPRNCARFCKIIFLRLRTTEDLAQFYNWCRGIPIRVFNRLLFIWHSFS